MKKMEELKKAMKDSISEILETMFFMPLEFPEEGDIGEIRKCGQTTLLSAQLKYQGPISGSFFVVAPTPLARELTANLLGLENKDLNSEHVEATLKELLNMVTGKTFSLYDSKSTFDLGMPQMISSNEIMTSLTDDLSEEIELVAKTVDGIIGFKVTVVWDHGTGKYQSSYC